MWWAVGQGAWGETSVQWRGPGGCLPTQAVDREAEGLGDPEL